MMLYVHEIGGASGCVSGLPFWEGGGGTPLHTARGAGDDVQETWDLSSWNWSWRWRTFETKSTVLYIVVLVVVVVVENESKKRS